MKAEIVAKEDLIDMSRRKAGIGFRGDNSRMMQDRVEAEVVELGGH